MAWCLLNESPAVTAPSIRDEVSNVTDTTSNAIIWRRHERPTDAIFTPQAGISLRSAINNAWGTLSYPTFADPDTSVGSPGDVNSTTNEFTTLVNTCDARYAALGRSGIGVTAVNVNLWTDATGKHTFKTGQGGCSFTGPPGSPCTSDFSIVVADNHYFYPTVPNRTIPGLPGTPMADPRDQLTAHETGHALGLGGAFDSYVNGHRADPTALMNPQSVDADADGRTDNVGLNATEVTQLRASAQNVPGLETDPPGQFVPGDVQAARVMDGPRQRGLAGQHDLAALTVSLDARGDQVHLAQRLWGLLACKSRTPIDYVYAGDLDNSARTGASTAALSALGIPGLLAASGVDLVATVRVTGGARRGTSDFRTCRATARAVGFRGGRAVALTNGGLVARISTFRTLEPHYPLPPRQLTAVALRPRDLFNTIDLRVRNRALPRPIRLRAPFRFIGLTASGRKALDVLGNPRRGATFVIERPEFPHCFPAGTGRAAGTVAVRFDGLKPNREIYAAIGSAEVLRDVDTDSRGGGTLQLPIPAGTAVGDHLVTIGHFGLGLTADCTVTVER
jgi:hypothetical protein